MRWRAVIEQTQYFRKAVLIMFILSGIRCTRIFRIFCELRFEQFIAVFVTARNGKINLRQASRHDKISLTR